MPDSLDLRGEELAPGVIVRALRAHAGRVEHVTLDTDLSQLGFKMDEAQVGLYLESDRVSLEVDGGNYAWSVGLEPRPASGSELVLGVSDVWVFGAPERSVAFLGTRMAGALVARGVPVTVEGIWTVSVDLVNGVRRRLAPNSGLLRGDLAWRVETTSPAAVRLRGRRSRSGSRSGRQTSRPLDATDLTPTADLPESFHTLSSQLTDTTEEEATEARLLAFGLGVPELRKDVDTLARRVLERRPNAVSALLARASLLAHRGHSERAIPYLEHAAQSLREAGARRAAGLALRFASLAYHDAPGDRARHLEDVIALRPDDRTALSELLACLPVLGRDAAAVRVARRLARVERTAEGRGRAHLTAGRLLLEGLNEAEQAKREIERAAKDLGRDPELIEVQARAAAALGAYARAEELVTHLLQDGSVSEEAEDRARLLLLLGTWMANRDPEGALSRFQEARALLPDRLEPLARLAMTARAAGRRAVLAEAVAAAEPLIARGVSPADRSHAFDLSMLAGQQLEEKGDIQRASGLFRAASGLDPTSREPHRAMEELAERAGNPKDRIEAILAQARLAIRAEDVGPVVQLLERLAKIDSLPQAARAEGRAMVRAFDGHHAGRVPLLEVELALSEGDLEAVVEVFERRIRRETETRARGRLYTRLGAALEQGGRTVEATHAYEEAIRSDVEDVEPYRTVTRLYRARGDQERLAGSLERLAARETDPAAKAQALVEGAQLWRIRGDEAEALAVVERALEVVPEDEEVLRLAVELALTVGEHERARQLAERRLAVLPPEATQDRLATYLDLATAHDRARNRPGVVVALREAHRLGDLETDAGLRVARRLARELWAIEAFDELATLHRRLGQITTLDDHQRAEHFVEAAQLACRLGAHEQVEVDAAEAFKLLGDPPVDRALALAALDALAASADARSDAALRAVVFGRRAAWAQSAEEREKWVLAHAEALVESGRAGAAQSVLEEAAAGLPNSIAVEELLGVVAQQADRPIAAAAAFGRAAALSEERGESRRAVELHGRAADIYTLEGHQEEAFAHDQAIFRMASTSAVESAWLKTALERLLAAAQRESDFELWSRVLERQAARNPPEEVAAAYLELAEAQLEVGGRERGVLDALRRARDRASQTSRQSDVVHTRLAEVLSRTGLFAELAQVWTGWAERTENSVLRAERYVEAARVLLERIKDKTSAMLRLEAALRADADNEAARQLRLRIFRENADDAELAEALAEEAERSADATRAAQLWLEAARRTAPYAQDKQNPALAERALRWAMAAQTAAPNEPEAAFLGAEVARQLGRTHEERDALSRAIEREAGSIRAAAARIRRAELLCQQSSGSEAIDEVEQTFLAVLVRSERDRSRIEDALDPESQRILGTEGSFVSRVGRWALRAAEQVSEWGVGVRVCRVWAGATEDPHQRAELLLRAARLYEWKLGDEEGAERELRAALVVAKDHAATRRALLRLLESNDRFDDVAEYLGPNALLGIWARFDVEPTDRRIRVGEAIRRRLVAQEEDRAPVLLALADLYAAGSREAEAVGVLEEVADSGPESWRQAAFDRLEQLFENEASADRYCSVLRRRAEGSLEPAIRAEAFARLGKALESTVGDPAAAESAYRCALVADRENASARQGLAGLWAAQDRFDEIGGELGGDTLDGVVRRLFKQGPAERERALRAAETRGALLDSEACAEHWLEVADLLHESPHDEAAQELAALQRAAAVGGTHERRALERLRQLLGETEDPGTLIEVLERLRVLEPDGAASVVVPLARARIARAQELGASGKDLELRAEDELQAILEVEPPDTQADALLSELWIRQQRYRELGARHGTGVLDRLLEETEEPGERKRLLEARASLTEGPERSETLFRLLDLVDVPADDAPDLGIPRTTLDVCRAILDRDPDSSSLRDRVQSYLCQTGHYAEVAGLFGVEALRAVVREMGDDQPGAEVAFRGLADCLEGDPLARQERGDLLVRSGRVHEVAGRIDAAQEAYTLAYRTARDPNQAGRALCDLLVHSDRVAELARIDEALAVLLAVRASYKGQASLQLEALEAVAAVRSGAGRADALTWAAAVESINGDRDGAQKKLEEALDADPNHLLARAELSALLLDNDASGRVIDRFGPEVFLDVVGRWVRRDPERALRLLGEIPEESPDKVLALRSELAGRSSVPSEDPHEDRARRRRGLQTAQKLYAALKDSESDARVRLRLLSLEREAGDSLAILEALGSAREAALRSEVRAKLAVEEAAMVASRGRVDAARHLVTEVIMDGSLTPEIRLDAAAFFVDSLEPVDRSDSVQRCALELLGAHHALVEARDDRVAEWFRRLAEAREAAGDDGVRVSEALEQVLLRSQDAGEVLAIRRRLVALAEELGDWSTAERHATKLAESERSARSWVGVSELRRWLDDPQGAREALKRALELEPDRDDAHRALVELAEQGRDSEEIIARLAAWSEAGAPVEASVERLLRAAEVAVEAEDAARAEQLADEALRLLPTDHPEYLDLARAASEILAPVGAIETRIAILRRAVQVGWEGASARLLLADLLVDNGRAPEALEVLQSGLDEEAPAEGPLLERIVREAADMDPSRGAPWLLGIADDVGGGPASRRLREVAAEQAEAGGDLELARSAWLSVVAEPGSGAAGVRARSALVRLHRSLGDASALLSVLLESAEDAENVEDQVARLVEAAAVSDWDLQDVPQADALYVRARGLAPDDKELRQQYVAFLEKHGRWLELEQLLANESLDLEGEQLSEFCVRRAEIVRARLRDETKAAALYVQAYEADPQLRTGDLAVGALARAGSLADAISMAERVLEDDAPGNHPLHLSIALARAELLELDGRVDEAVSTLQRLAEQEGGTGVVQARLRALLERTGRWTELADYLSRVADTLEPFSGVRARLAAARIWETQNERSDDAHAALRAVYQTIEGWLTRADDRDLEPLARLAPTGVLSSADDGDYARSQSVLVDLAGLACGLGQRNLQMEALRLLAEALPNGRDQWAALLLLANAEREEGDVAGAERTVRRVFDAHQEAADVPAEDRIAAERVSGEVLVHKGRYEEALDAFQSARDLLAEGGGREEEDAYLLYRLGAVHSAAGQLEEAVTRFQAARRKDPNSVPEDEFARVVERAGPSEALAVLLTHRAHRHEQGKERADLFRRAHRLWVDLGQEDRALDALIAAQESEPEDAETTDLLTVQLEAAGRYRELMVVLDRTLSAVGEDDPEAVEALLDRIARAADRLDRPEDALVLVKRVVRRFPDRPKIVRLLAELSERAGQIETSDEAWRWVGERSMDPQVQRDAAKRRARLLGEAGAVKKRAHVLAEALAARISEATPAELIAVDGALAESSRHEARTRLWADASEDRSGSDAATCLAQIGALRRDALADPRGAILAFEMATRVDSEDLALRRAAMEAARAFHDHRKVVKHARAAADRAPTRRGRCAFLKEAARAWAAMGELGSELEVWGAVLHEGGPVPAVLAEIEARARDDLPAKETVELLKSEVQARSEAVEKAALLRVQAGIMERVLGEADAAATLLEDASTLDPLNSEIGVEETNRPVEPLEEESFRRKRSMLDRSGHLEELAELEAAQARASLHPHQRAVGLARAAERVLEVHAKDDEGEGQSRISAARALLQESLQWDPDGVLAWGLFFELSLQQNDLAEARRAADALVELGGPGWVAPRFEEGLIRLARAENDAGALATAIARAQTRAPWSLAVRLAKIELSSNPDEEMGVLDSVLEATDLACVLEQQARQALEQDRPALALERARRARLLRPRDEQIQRTLWDAMAAAGIEVELLDACLAEIARSGPSAWAVRRALDVAEHAPLWPPVSERLTRVAEYLADAEPEVLDRLIRLGVKHQDGPLLACVLWATGTPERLGAPEPVAFGRLAKTLLDRDEWEDAAEVLNVFLPVEADANPTDGFEVASREAFSSQGGLAAVLLRAPRRAGPAWVRCLRALHRTHPDTPGVVEARARSLLPDPGARPEALELVRELVRKRPLELEWIEALAECSDGPEYAGRRAVARYLASGRADPIESSPRVLCHEASEASLRVGDPSPLGEILRLGARAAAADLRPPTRSGWRPGDEDARLEGLLGRVRASVRNPFEVFVDPLGGYEVRLMAGDPPGLVVGEALADDVSPGELRFWIARGARLLELGYLVVHDPGERGRLVRRLVEASIEGSVTGDLQVLSRRLGDSARSGIANYRADMESVSSLDWGRWIRATLRSADRFGLLVSGDLPSVVRAVMRRDYRLAGVSTETRTDRVRLLRTWSTLRLLAEFALTEDFAALLAGEAPPLPGRF